MNNELSLQGLWDNTRARVYLVWALIVAVGFTATHFYQNPNINFVWVVLSIAGLGYMYKVMPLRISQMKKIFQSWLFPILFGVVVSIIAVRTSLLPNLVGFLGVFWMLVMAIGFVWNGLVDRPAFWYFVGAGINIAGALASYTIADLLEIQYIVAAVVSTLAMLLLWLYRSED